MFPGPRFLPLLIAFGLAATVLAQPLVDARQSFVNALIRVLEGVPGTFGDERASVSAALAAMEMGLRSWDEQLRRGRDTTARDLSDAEKQFGLGLTSLDRGRSAEAITELTSALNAGPSNGDIRLIRGLAYDSQGDTASASADYFEAWTAHPADLVSAYMFLFRRPPSAPSTLSSSVEGAAARITEQQRRTAATGRSVANVFARLALLNDPNPSEPVFVPARYAAAARHLRERNYDALLTALLDAWKDDPLNTDPAAGSASLVAGASALREARWPDAIARFETASHEFASSSESRRLLATAYWLNDDDGKAIEQLRAAIAIAPRDDRARITLADVYIGRKEFVDAERELSATVALMPQSGQAHWRLARVFDAAHRDLDARGEREAAVALAPVAGESRARSAIARAYLNESNVDKAIDAARARVAIDFNDASAHDQLGQVFQQAGRDADALVELSVAALFDPDLPNVESRIAQLQLAAGHYTEAIDAARRAITRNPRNREARFALARALLQTGSEAEGKSELAAAEQLQTEELVRVRQTFATNLIRIEAAQREQQQKWDEAVSLRRDVIGRADSVPSDLALLGEALSKTGQHAEAIAAYRAAIAADPEPDTYRALIRECLAAGRTADADAARAEYQRVQRQRFLESTGVK